MQFHTDSENKYMIAQCKQLNLKKPDVRLNKTKEGFHFTFGNHIDVILSENEGKNMAEWILGILKQNSN